MRIRPPSERCTWWKRMSCSWVAENSRTGTLTRPKETAPFQIARTTPPLAPSQGEGDGADHYGMYRDMPGIARARRGDFRSFGVAEDELKSQAARCTCRRPCTRGGATGLAP